MAHNPVAESRPSGGNARPAGTQEFVRIRRVPWGRWSFGTFVALIMLLLAASLASNTNMQWNVVPEYIVSRRILDGVRVTLTLTVIGIILASILGAILALMMLSANPVLRVLGRLYVWLFRGTPLLVQLIFWFNLGLLFPRLFLGIPGTELVVFSANTNDVITGFIASILGLTMHEAAYQGENFRAGIQGVPPGQREAALAIGMTDGIAMKRIILPQAIRLIIPPTGNRLISLLKETSLVSVIGGGDLLTNAENIYSGNFKVVGLLVVATLWYLLLTSLAMRAQQSIEQRLRHGRRGSREFG